MDLSAISEVSGLRGLNKLSSVSSMTGVLTGEQEKTTGTLFESFLDTAIDNIRTANGYLSDAEDEKLKFAMGETENTHDLMIAMQKASTALQYTVTIRDKLLEAYKEIMQMQI